jgi:cytochrome d ubiquinol oxidase subunit I
VLRLFGLAIALPYLANSAGWLLTEVGRFPWVVFGLVKLEDGVSQVVTPGMLLVSLIGYILVYGLLIFATIYLLRKYAQAGPPPAESAGPALADAGPTPSLIGAAD